MRYRILGLLVLVVGTGCTADNPLYVGDTDGGGGGSDGALADGGGGKHDQGVCPPSCNDDALPRDLSMTEPPDLTPPAPDLAPRQCAPNCSKCAGGGACCPGASNGGCCRSGEWCENGNTCRCGDGPACTSNGDRCASSLIMFNQCGSTCCGSLGHPCPL